MMEHASAIPYTAPAEGPDAWLQHFELRYNPFYNPFAVTDDGSELLEDVFYPGAQRAEVLDQLDLTCRNGSGVTVVAGAEGSGRSLMCRQLHQALQRGCRVAFLQAQLLRDAGQVLQALACDLRCGLPEGASPGEIMAALRRELQQALEPLVILIDDAHLLDDSLLGGLVSLLGDGGAEGASLHLLMFGDEELAARLDQFTPVEVLLQDLWLEPLSVTEAADYLQHKWSQAGASEPLPLSLLQLQRLWQRSGGNPASLDHLAEAALAQVAAEAGSRSGIPVAHLFALVALVSILLVAFLYRDSWFEPEEEGMSASVNLDTGLAAPAGDARRVAAPLVVPAPGISRSEFTGARPMPVSPLAPSQSVGGNEGGAVPASGSPEVGVESPQALTAPESAGLAADWTEQSEPAEAKLDIAPPPAGQSSVTVDEQKLLAMPASHLLLQVVAAGTRDSLLEFVRRQPNRNELLIFETSRNGKPWYVVVIGSFADRDAAAGHLAALPDEQRRAGPWVKAVAEVQAEIRRYRGS